MISKVLLSYVNACREAIVISENVSLDIPKPDNVIFAGMGGSGISGNLVKDIIQDSVGVPMHPLRGYTLPKYVSEKTLVFCTSYSGNTEETLSQFVEAVKRKCSIISICSAGKLLEWSQKLDIPVIRVPAGYVPREALPYLLFPLLVSMQKIFQLDFSKDVEEFLQLVPKIDLKKIDEISHRIKDSMPVICGDSDFFGILRRIKSQLNENSKMLARFEELPELNHNEVVGYELFENPAVSMIFVRDIDENKMIKHRIEITKDVIGDKVKNFHDIWSYGSSKLSKVLSLVYQGDYLSFKLAEARNVDWQPTKNIDNVKEGLKELGTVQKLEKELGFIS